MSERFITETAGKKDVHRSGIPHPKVFVQISKQLFGDIQIISQNQFHLTGLFRVLEKI